MREHSGVPSEFQIGHLVPDRGGSCHSSSYSCLCAAVGVHGTRRRHAPPCSETSSRANMNARSRLKWVGGNCPCATVRRGGPSGGWPHTTVACQERQGWLARNATARGKREAGQRVGCCRDLGTVSNRQGPASRRLALVMLEQSAEPFMAFDIVRAKNAHIVRRLVHSALFCPCRFG